MKDEERAAKILLTLRHAGPLSGFSLASRTGMRVGKIYPILAQLEKARRIVVAKVDGRYLYSIPSRSHGRVV